MTTGKLRYLLADLAALQHAAVVVEDRYSAVFKLEHIRPAVVADGLGEAAAQFPAVPIVFAETRPLAQEWTYRFLGAALVHHHDDRLAARLRVELPRPDLSLRRSPRPPRSGRGHACTGSPCPTAAGSDPRSGPPTAAAARQPKRR